jgi:hypothetical protein
VWRATVPKEGDEETEKTINPTISTNEFEMLIDTRAADSA